MLFQGGFLPWSNILISLFFGVFLFRSIVIILSLFCFLKVKNLIFFPESGKSFQNAFHWCWWWFSEWINHGKSLRFMLLDGSFTKNQFLKAGCFQNKILFWELKTEKTDFFLELEMGGIICLNDFLGTWECHSTSNASFLGSYKLSDGKTIVWLSIFKQSWFDTYLQLSLGGNFV